MWIFSRKSSLMPFSGRRYLVPSIEKSDSNPSSSILCPSFSSSSDSSFSISISPQFRNPLDKLVSTTRILCLGRLILRYACEACNGHIHFFVNGGKAVKGG